MTPEDRARFSVTLAAPEGSQMTARYESRQGSRLGPRLLEMLRPPAPVIHNRAERRIDWPVGGLVLYVGGGGRSVPECINLDIGDFPGVDLIGNVERLPFLESSIDAVECDAVLEHVEHPVQAVAEIHRVLKPGGQVHAVVPFCHPVHAYPADYNRWTLAGLHSLFGSFEVLASGIRSGPTAAMLTLFLDYVKLWMPGRQAQRAAYALAGWLLFPLRYLDLFLMRQPRAEVLANHVYILARKKC